MISNRKTNFVVFLTIFVVLCQIHFNMARPNSGRGNRRNSQNKLKENKAKRGWPVSPPVEEAEPLKEDNFIELDESITEQNDAETKKENVRPLQPRKWLELEGLLPPHIKAPLNSDLTLECVAVGSPPPTIYWLKDGKPIENVTPFDTEQLANHVLGRSFFRNPKSNDFSMAKVKSKIPLRCLKPEDNDVEYTCVADNDGRQMLSTTTVTIEDDGSSEVRPECETKSSIFSYSKKGKKGQPAFIMSSESLRMEVSGKDIVITCRGAGRPRPQISWVDNGGRKIVNGKKFHVTHSGNLVIRNLSWNEMGEFTCLVENPLGSDSASTFLYPLKPEES